MGIVFLMNTPIGAADNHTLDFPLDVSLSQLRFIGTRMEHQEKAVQEALTRAFAQPHLHA